MFLLSSKLSEIKAAMYLVLIEVLLCVHKNVYKHGYKYTGTNK